MKTLIFGIVFLSPPFLKKIILRQLCGAQFGRKATIGWFSSVMGRRLVLGDYSTVKPLTLIRCDGEVKVGKYTEISSFSVIYGRASLRVGNHCYLGPQAWINVSEDVTIGNRVGIGPRSMIFTHGSFLPYTEGYWARFGKITIGNNVYLAAGVFLHPGVQIEDNVFVNSRSVITQSIRSGEILEGFPAKKVTLMEKMRRNVTPAKKDALILNILKHFFSFLKETNNGIVVNQNDNNENILQCNGKEYLIVLINSQGRFSVDHKMHQDKILIILVNDQAWMPESKANAMLVFNFISMRTPETKDKVHRELYQFMKLYYGIIFEYDQC